MIKTVFGMVDNIFPKQTGGQSQQPATSSLSLWGRMKKVFNSIVDFPSSNANQVGNGDYFSPVMSDIDLAPPPTELSEDQILQKAVIGPQEWISRFGKGSLKRANVPKLNREKAIRILQEPCPFDPSKKIYETHTLVFIPDKMWNKQLNLGYVQELFRSMITNDLISIGANLIDNIDANYCVESGWFLVKNSGLKAQELIKCINLDYEVVKSGNLIAAIDMQRYLRNNIGIDNGFKPVSYRIWSPPNLSFESQLEIKFTKNFNGISFSRSDYLIPVQRKISLVDLT